MEKFVPANSFESPRFCGVRTFMRLPHISDIVGKEVDFAIVGAPFDTGASFRVGTRFAPEHIRGASVLLRPYNPIQDINIFDYLSGVDYGDAPVVPGYIEDSYQKIAKTIYGIAKEGTVPIVLGGDHSISLANLRGVSSQHGELCLIHFDSHADTWDSYFEKPYTHGTPFRRATEEKIIDPHHSIQIGMRGPLYEPGDWQDSERMGFTVLPTHVAKEMSADEIAATIKKTVGDRKVFLTFDIDFVDPAYAPGTGTPEAGGFSSYETLKILRKLTDLNIVGYDLVEVLPAYDQPAEITSFLAAAIIYEFITAIAMRKRAKE